MMRNKRFIIALACAIVCGLLGVLAVTRYLSQLNAFAKDLGNVVVAKQEIPLGAKITADQLTLAPIPNGSLPDGVFRKIDQVVGRVAIQSIGVRETVTGMKLAPEGTGGGLSAVIPEGYRAVTVKVDDVVGVSGFVMPGSYVDVVSVITPPGQDGAQGPISKIVLQHIKVLASGPKIDSPENQREPTSVKAVTLMVTPEQAEKLVLAANEGKLQLVMRNYSDDEDAPTTGTDKNKLLRGDNVKPEPPPPSETQPEKPKTTWVKHTPVKPKMEKPVAPATAAQQTKNSIELIEGAKRRDVQIQ
jgi:pilus assembly protein CpaB